MNIIEMAEQAGLAYKTPKGKYWIDAGYPDIHLERFAELVAAAEREACAKVCNSLHDCEPEHSPDDCAAAIRARGEK